MDEVRNIPTEHLVEPWAILRPVAKGSIEYMEMMDSLAETGFWNSISVRQPAAAVYLRGEVELGLAGHHPQDAPGQRGVLGVGLRGDAILEENIKMDALAAGRVPDLDVGQVLGLLADRGQLFVADTDARSMASNAVKVEGDPPGLSRPPIPARAADALGMVVQGPG